ncbi:multidrug effflux MFS transporter [Legionella longbeachae]|uniref:Putative major facilitator superfamily (MFS) transporter n=2 Tax=Legionella longbeachae TaxID=450 RepID=D3HT18_LEGLN|nr:multidrug effflux MFS transporter [Legionella longbeachae]HBD7398809.1 multidrug effflux MFS transporter [Legionella pneumophila]ARB91182.1 MFS transporter [Legionella longbeachae]ARM32391.1 multidrug effflux MFS transporter [Legionella longbeachae]QEY51651.1 multidrug effflux MFS transporter [Legionella longbeachae]QIN32391.1 MFS transporter [Legionella longbeachae]
MLSSLFRLPLVPLIVISLLGCCMEIDISLPSFPSIMSYFGSTEAQVQSTLSLNFLAFCLSGLLYGPLSESWGRRGLMLFGATCFLIGAVGCVFSFSIYQLMFWRFIQGLGASSTLVMGFAMISDRYSGEVAANYIGKINAYVTIFMAAAPILGSAIINYFTWRANFTFVAMIALISWLFLIWQLPETKTKKQPLSILTLFKDYWTVFSHGKFVIYASMPNMLVTAYLTFVGSASFYYINTCKLSYFQFAMQQGMIVLIFSLTSFYAEKVIARIGSRKAVNFGMVCCTISIVLFTYFAFDYPESPHLITFAMCWMAVGCAFPMSVTFAQSLEILPNLKGTCSSFIMSTRLFVSSGAVALTGLLFDGSMRPVALVIDGAIIIGISLYFLIERMTTSNDNLLEVT